MPPIPKPKPKTIGIVGSRRRSDVKDMQACIRAFEKVYKPGDRIVSGGCSLGADRFAEEIAKQRGVTITIHYPDKSRLDKNLAKTNLSAAWAIIDYARNTLIAQESDILIALVAEDRKGGTEDSIKKAVKLGKKIILV